MLPILSFIQRIGITEAIYEGELFSRSGYIATNIGKEKAGYEIVKIYRKRARQKQAIEELKNEFHHFFLSVKDFNAKIIKIIWKKSKTSPFLHKSWIFK